MFQLILLLVQYICVLYFIADVVVLLDFEVFICVEYFELNMSLYCIVLPSLVIGSHTLLGPFWHISQMTDTQNVQNIYIH